MTDSIKEQFKNKRIRLYDYCEDELFAWMNASLTAEGIISILLNKSISAICDMNCLVLGFGRIAKLFAKKISSLGANITIAARSKTAKAEANANGYDVININDLINSTNRYHTIINTIPVKIISNNTLDKYADSIIIDVASLPGGFDYTYACQNGIPIIQALGIPGKNTPYSASKVIYKVIEEHSKEIS